MDHLESNLKREIPEDWIINYFFEILKKNKDYLHEKYRVKEIGAFGSHIHNEQEENSDLDILVDFDEPPSLFEFLDMEEYLAKILGIKVDLVMKSSLKKHIGKHILDEVVYL